MGELGIGITDLGPCMDCTYGVAMIFEDEKNGFWVACGHRKCEHKTGYFPELLDACSAWGLKPFETGEQE